MDGIYWTRAEKLTDEEATKRVAGVQDIDLEALRKEREEVRAWCQSFCETLGCSGLSSAACSRPEQCEIIRKLVLHARNKRLEGDDGPT